MVDGSQSTNRCNDPPLTSFLIFLLLAGILAGFWYTESVCRLARGFVPRKAALLFTPPTGAGGTE